MAMQDIGPPPIQTLARDAGGHPRQGGKALRIVGIIALGVRIWPAIAVIKMRRIQQQQIQPRHLPRHHTGRSAKQIRLDHHLGHLGQMRDQRSIGGQQCTHLPAQGGHGGGQSAHHIRQAARFDQRHRFRCDR